MDPGHGNGYRQVAAFCDGEYYAAAGDGAEPGRHYARLARRLEPLAGQRARWRDLHVLNRAWLLRRGLLHAVRRAVLALLLCASLLSWQYQVYFLWRPVAA